MHRALHVTRDFPPRVNGGISVAVGQMVDATNAAGHQCTVLSFDNWRPKTKTKTNDDSKPTENRQQGLRVLRVSCPAHLEAATAFARSVAPTILHVHHAMLWPFAAELRSLLGVPAVLTTHVVQSVQNRLRNLTGETMSSRAQRQAVAEADYVLAPSLAAGDALASDYHLLAERLAITRLGIQDSETARRAAAAQRTQPRLLYAGRFADINGTRELFETLIALAKRLPEVELAVAGGVPDNQRAARRWQEQFAALAGPALADRVQFLGWLDREQLSIEYARASVLIAPSWFETFGLAIGEGMLHGLPIIATNAGAIPELVTDQSNGLLSSPRETARLIENAVVLLCDMDHARSLGRAGAEHIRETYRWDHAIAHVIAIYDRLSPFQSP